jgi:hypothetical protein
VELWGRPPVVLEGLRSQKAVVLRFCGVVGPAPCSVRGPEVSEGCGPEVLWSGGAGPLWC